MIVNNKLAFGISSAISVRFQLTNNLTIPARLLLMQMLPTKIGKRLTKPISI